MASQDVQAILAALQGATNTSPIMRPQDLSTAAAQQPSATPTNQAQHTHFPPVGQPAPAYSAVVPAPPQQSSYPPYPQPAATGNIDLNAIRPVGHGNVNFQDALAKVQGFATSRGIPQPSSGMPDLFIALSQLLAQKPTTAVPPPRQDPRLAGRPPVPSRSRSRSPPHNYNPYRDERRDDPRRQNGYPRERSRSPSRGQREQTYAATRDRDYGRDDPDSEVISIESNLVGLVIGRGGDNLKKIEKETGARIQFITGPQHNGPQRDCRLSGPARCRQDAKHAIWRILDENGGLSNGARSSQPPQTQNKPRQQAAGLPKLREGENSVQIMVPDKTVGLIIGRGGETIRDLQEKSQCHINIVGENKSVNGLRPVNLIGSIQASQLARELILEIVDSDSRDQQQQSSGARPPQQDRRPAAGAGAGAGGPDKITEMIRVPSDSVGMIIGKGGETIKEMQAQTGCKINVQQASGQDIERPIELVGDYAAIGRAKAAIWDKVEQVVSGINLILSSTQY
jgi:far upstream element-binding protein